MDRFERENGVILHLSIGVNRGDPGQADCAPFPAMRPKCGPFSCVFGYKTITGVVLSSDAKHLLKHASVTPDDREIAKPVRKNSGSQFSTLPTAAGFIARAAYSRAVTAGISTKSLLQRAGLTPLQIKNAKVRIGARNQIKLLNLVGDALRTSISASVSQRYDLRELGLLYYVPASSDTLAVRWKEWRDLVGYIMRGCASHTMTARTSR